MKNATEESSLKAITIKTRVSKDVEPIETILSIDFDCTEEQLKELAQRSIVIQYQSNLRASGIIPKEDTLKVSDLFKRTPRAKKVQTPEDIVAMAKANPELLALLKEMLK